MLEQTTQGRIQQAVQLSAIGQKAEAAALCRSVLTHEPHNLPALLWLGYTSPQQIESEEAIAKAYDLAPQHPSVLQAVSWYNTHFVEHSAGATPAGSNPPPPNKPERNVLHTPVGDPVEDTNNFFMSQTGGMVIGSTVAMILGFGAFFNYLVFRLVSFRPFALPRELLGLLGLGLGIAAIAFLFFAVRDVIVAPVKTHGFITNRKQIRQEIKSNMGTMVDFHYELYFLSDEAKAEGKLSVRLTLTKEQYEASAITNRAYVVYSKQLGSVRLYQPLRSVLLESLHQNKQPTTPRVA